MQDLTRNILASLNECKIPKTFIYPSTSINDCVKFWKDTINCTNDTGHSLQVAMKQKISVTDAKLDPNCAE